MLFLLLSFSLWANENTNSSEDTEKKESASEAESKTTDDSSSSKESSENTMISPTEASEDIIVYGQREADRRRRVLDQNLQNNGYRDGKRRGDKVIYRPETVWKPSVVVHDSGWVDLKRTPPRFEPWIKAHPDNKWAYVSCIPPFTIMCVRASGWLISKRRAQHSKTEVIDQNIDYISSWQEAVAGVATQERLEFMLPTQLDAIWSDPSDRPYTERRQDLLDLWASRTCTPEGNQAAEIIASFLEYEVQESLHPIQQEEINNIEKNECNRKLPFTIETSVQ